MYVSVEVTYIRQPLLFEVCIINYEFLRWKLTSVYFASIKLVDAQIAGYKIYKYKVYTRKTYNYDVL